jgi:outer membrane protein assembly factor BamB
MGASPIVCDDKVIMICDQNVESYIAAFDCKDGREIWRTARPEATSGHCTPIVIKSSRGESQIVAIGSFYVTAYAPASGEKLWWVGGLCFEMKSTPVVHGDILYINGYGSPMNEEQVSFSVKDFGDVLAEKDGDGNQKLTLAEMPDELAKNFFPVVDLDNNGSLVEKEWEYFQASIASKNSMMAIRLGGSGDMTAQSIIWKYFKNIPQLPSPILYNDRLFMISDQGIVTSLNPQTGESLKRGRLQGAAGNVYASPVAADGKLFFVTEKGLVAVTDASDEFKVLAVNNLEENCYATPAFDERRIYIRTEKGLYAFGL